MGSVGALVLMTAAAGLWSGLTGPRMADVQLGQAAANLAASSSFVVVINETESEIGTAVQARIHEVVDYVAPDRQMVTRTISAGSFDRFGNAHPNRSGVLDPQYGTVQVLRLRPCRVDNVHRPSAKARTFIGRDRDRRDLFLDATRQHQLDLDRWRR